MSIMYILMAVQQRLIQHRIIQIWDIIDLNPFDHLRLLHIIQKTNGWLHGHQQQVSLATSFGSIAITHKDPLSPHDLHH